MCIILAAYVDVVKLHGALPVKWTVLLLLLKGRVIRMGLKILLRMTLELRVVLAIRAGAQNELGDRGTELL